MIEIADNGTAFTVAAELIADGLKIAAADVQALLTSGGIATASEAGVDADAGTFRLTFSTRQRRLRIVVDAAGRVVARSVVDFGDQPLPQRARRAPRPGAG